MVLLIPFFLMVLGRRKCPFPVQLDFIVDFAGFATAEIRRAKFLINSIARGFHFSAEGARASLLTYELNNLKLTQVSTYHDFMRATDQISTILVTRRLQLAFNQTAARALSFRSLSRDTANVVVLVTDGGIIPTSGDSWKAISKASQLLQEAGVAILIIGLRGTTIFSKLRSLVQKRSDIFLARNFEELNSHVDDIRETVCLSSGKINTHVAAQFCFLILLHPYSSIKILESI